MNWICEEWASGITMGKIQMKLKSFFSLLVREWKRGGGGRRASMGYGVVWIYKKELCLMNEPEIGISYHAPPDYSKMNVDDIAHYFDGAHHSLLAQFSFQPRFFSVYGAQKEISKENCEQIIFFFAPFIIFYQAYLFWNISIRYTSNIYAINFFSTVFDQKRGKKLECTNNDYNKVDFFLLLYECVC